MPLSQIRQGFHRVAADQAAKDQALKNLERWLSDAEFAPYRPQLEWLIHNQEWAGLLDRFYQILPFGTGGRRGPVGIGPNRMNLWTLGASVQGHCEYLKERFPGQAPLRVVVAYDVRQFKDKRKNYNPDLPNPVLGLSSKTFAQYAVGVYTANGIHAHILPETSTRYLATPELSFIIRLLHAHAGLNISASHNPPDDNGGKFYDERGGQPVAPDDQIMADLALQVTAIKVLPWPDAVRGGKVRFLDDGPHHAYIELCRKQSLVPPPRRDEIKVVFTPLHGVGGMTAMEILVKQGFKVIPVPEQMEPDGQFPNVTETPNPEVPACFDRAEAVARAHQADLILATDPDADRLGAMVPEPGEPSRVSGRVGGVGGWRYLNGNTLAALATHFKLAKLSAEGQLPDNPIVIKTLVTTSLVTRIARHFQAQVVENLLVGFKFIADVLWQLEQNGCYEDVRGRAEDFVLGCEESHGLQTTHQLRDKDAGGAALLFAELALDQKRKRQSVVEYLQAIERQFGYFKNEVRTITLPGIEGKRTMATMLDKLRQNPPAEIAGLAVTGMDDLLSETSWLGPFKGATDRAARNFLHFRLGETARVALRPSGTEPKAKAYIEVCALPCEPGTSPVEWQKLCASVDRQATAVGDDFLHKALGLVGMTPPR